MLPRFASELGLTDAELSMVDDVVAHAKPEHVERGAEQVRAHGLRAFVHIAQSVRDDVIDEIDSRDFLR